MALITKTVAPSGGDFTTLKAALDSTTSVNGNDIKIVIQGNWSGSPDTGGQANVANIFNNGGLSLEITTDAANYFNGTWDTSKYIFRTASGTQGFTGGTLQEPRIIKISGIQNEMLGHGCGFGISSRGYIYYEDCAVKGSNSSSWEDQGWQIYYWQHTLKVVAKNCFAFDIVGTFSASGGLGFWFIGEGGHDTNANIILNNCTVRNCVVGYKREQCNVTMRNCIYQGSGTSSSGTFNSASSNNATSTGSMAGSSVTSASFSFLSSSSCVLTAGSPVKAAGLNLFNDPDGPVRKDAAQNYRPNAAQTIGAYEYPGTLTIDSLSPTDNATGVSIAPSLALNFNNNVKVGTGNVEIWKPTAKSTAPTVPTSGRANSATSTAATSISVSLAVPSGGFLENDVIVIGVSKDDDDAFTTMPPTDYRPGANAASGTAMRAAMFWRRVPSGFAGTTVSVQGDSEAYKARAWTLRGVDPYTDPLFGLPATGSSTSSDPPSVDATAWGSEPKFFAYYVGLDGASSSFSAHPSGHTDTGSVSAGAGTGNDIAHAYGELASTTNTSFNAGALTNTNAAWCANAFGVRAADQHTQIQVISIASGSVGFASDVCTITPSALDLNTDYYVKIANTAILDNASDDPFQGIYDERQWNFTTANSVSGTIINTLQINDSNTLTAVQKLVGTLANTLNINQSNTVTGVVKLIAEINNTLNISQTNTVSGLYIVLCVLQNTLNISQSNVLTAQQKIIAELANELNINLESLIESVVTTIVGTIINDLTIGNLSSISSVNIGLLINLLEINLDNEIHGNYIQPIESQPYNIKLNNLLDLIQRKTPLYVQANLSDETYDNKLKKLQNTIQKEILRLTKKTSNTGDLE